MPPRDDLAANGRLEDFGHDRTDQMRRPRSHNSDFAGRYDLAIIGAGPAGIAAAKAAAALGGKVALIERDSIGGANLNFGSVPSKALIRTSRLYAEMRDANLYGAQAPNDIRVDFAAVMARLRRIRARLSRAESAQRLNAAGIDVLFGAARFVAGDMLAIDGMKLRFRKALIATGARPHIPAIPGLAQAGCLTNENIFDLAELPRRLLVIGGGPLGCEQAQAFCHLGAQTTIAQDQPLFLGQEERDAALILSESFARDGIEVRLNTTAVGVRLEGGTKLVDLVSDDYRDTISADAILVGAGRLPNVQELDLEVAGIDYDPVGGIRVDDFLRSSNARVYAAGDVCLQHKYVDTAEASARLAVRNALARGRARWSAAVIPWCTYTDPEIARVGMSAREANERDIPVKTFTVPMHQVERAVTDSETSGFVKIMVRERTDRILGATIVARHAGEMINEITLAMVAHVGLRALSRVLHAYPTQSDAIRLAATACDHDRSRVARGSRARSRNRLAS
jgi:pyruvate/2-oxoglutarate dehydrogenase complex dihydrolipoamide dehydrogenase (E3) component